MNLLIAKMYTLESETTGGLDSTVGCHTACAAMAAQVFKKLILQICLRSACVPKTVTSDLGT